MFRTLFRCSMIATFIIGVASACAQTTTSSVGNLAPKPLFRDPIHDGAADPVLCFNNDTNEWFMFYTNRRANVPNTSGVSWVHGTEIGIAASKDGANWRYVGTANINIGGDEYSYWAPDVLEHDGTYHMFLTYVPGIFEHWGYPRSIHHLTSTNLIDWEDHGPIALASDRCIDATVLRLDDGTWRMWYNNEVDAKSIYYADSPDLFTWTDKGKAVGERQGEGPVVFRWKGRNWMIVDVRSGLGVYHSDDFINWVRQPENLVEQPGRGLDDQVIGRHAGVAIDANDRAYLFYFTHPGHHLAPNNADGYFNRRSSIQVVEMKLEDGKLVADRDAPTYINLGTPRQGARTR